MRRIEEINRNDYYNISELAQIMKRSDKTIRNMIKQEKLKGEQFITAYGPQWFFEKEAINAAEEVIEVVKVTKQIDMNELAISLTEFFQDKENQLLEKVNEKIDSVNGKLEEVLSENQKMKNEILKLQEQHYKDVDSLLRKALEPKQVTAVEDKKGFFAKIFKK